MSSPFDYFLSLIVAIWNWCADQIVTILSWDIETQYPDVYTTVSSFNTSLTTIGEAFCLILFLYGIAQTVENVHEIKPPKLLGLSIRYIVATAAVHYSTSIMKWFWDVSIGIITLISGTLETDNLHITLSDVASEAIEDAMTLDTSSLSLLDVFGSLGQLVSMAYNRVPLMLTVILTGLVILITIAIVYVYLMARFLRILIEVSLAPLGICFFANERTSQHGMAFIKSFAGDCLFGVGLTCGLYIFAAFMGSEVFADLSTNAVVDFIAENIVYGYLFCFETILKVILFALMIFGMRSMIKEKFNM